MLTTRQILGLLPSVPLALGSVGCSSQAFTALEVGDSSDAGASMDGTTHVVPSPDGAIANDSADSVSEGSTDSGSIGPVSDSGDPSEASHDAETDAACPTGFENCQNQCISVGNLSNCGGCGNICAGPANGSNGSGTATCVDAGCELTCASGAHVCGKDCLLNTDPPSTDPCIVSATYGVFVSPTGSDTSGNGTQASPYATIGKGASAAKSTGRLDIFACGTFKTTVTIDATMDGRKIYGGFDCSSWAWSATTNTVVAPSSRGMAMTVNGLTMGVTFTNFEFDAMAAPVNTGGFVLGVLVNSSVVELTNVTIKTGAGAMGPGGSTVANYTAAQAATGNPASGYGDGATQTCSCANPTGGVSEGGRGGGGDAVSPAAGVAGSSVPVVLIGAPSANAGSAQASTAGTCGNGGVGTAGSPGSGGTLTSLSLSLTSAGLSQSGGTGEPGAYGSIAQGGGGGGGGIAVTTGGGGSGGCGGCGGGYGSGGSPGGSSVALASVNSTVTLSACVLTAGAGGSGGTGGAGQPGQSGGFGGDGSTPGCNGGTGGLGGEGGGGAGGAGGSSLGIAYTGAIPTLTNGTQVIAGAVGGGGPAGAGGNAQAGNSGTSSTTPVLL